MSSIVAMKAAAQSGLRSPPTPLPALSRSRGACYRAAPPDAPPRQTSWSPAATAVEYQTAAVVRAPDCPAHVWLAPTDRAPPAWPSVGDCPATSHIPRGTTQSAASLLAHRHPPCPISPAGS